MKRRITTGIAGVGLVVLAACGAGHAKPAATAGAGAPVPATSVNAPAMAPAPAQAATAITTPDLTDVDNALASVDAEITNAQHDTTNEGAPQ